MFIMALPIVKALGVASADLLAEHLRAAEKQDQGATDSIDAKRAIRARAFVGDRASSLAWFPAPGREERPAARCPDGRRQGPIGRGQRGDGTGRARAGGICPGKAFRPRSTTSRGGRAGTSGSSAAFDPGTAAAGEPRSSGPRGCRIHGLRWCCEGKSGGESESWSAVESSSTVSQAIRAAIDPGAYPEGAFRPRSVFGVTDPPYPRPTMLDHTNCSVAYIFSSAHVLQLRRSNVLIYC